MTTPRIYSPASLENCRTCELEADNRKYLKQVLRLQPGDKVNVFDGFGHEYAAVIKGYSSAGVALEIREKIATITGPGIKITLAQALPKAGKMDTIVRHAAELCVDRIIPFVAFRCVGRMEKEKERLKTARWQKIAQEAARCCRSAGITEIAPVASYEEMLQQVRVSSLQLIFWEEETQTTIKDVLQDRKWSTADDIFIIVGPEGGLAKDEITMAREAGFISVSLGKHILKVETAALAILSIIQYEKGIFGNFAAEVKNGNL